MTRRVYVVGTSTDVGKTALVCSLLRWARKHNVKAVPFKPASSGASRLGETDVDRLLRAAGLPVSEATTASPWSFGPPLAPGLAENPTLFYRPPAANAAPEPEVIAEARARIARFEETYKAQLVLIEGAGGLHVPMPGGTWQTDWIRALATDVVVVGEAGLGTINHCLLTLDALTALDLRPVGFYLSDTSGAPDPSVEDNPQVIATARGARYLGTLAHQHERDARGELDLLAPLLDALPS